MRVWQSQKDERYIENSGPGMAGICALRLGFRRALTPKFPAAVSAKAGRKNVLDC